MQARSNALASEFLIYPERVENAWIGWGDANYQSPGRQAAFGRWLHGRSQYDSHIDDINIAVGNFAKRTPRGCNVTVDLNGFTISGPENGNGKGVDGRMSDNVTVINGTVQGMGSDGVTIRHQGRVEQVRAINNGADGILILGDDNVIRFNTAINNTGVGVNNDKDGKRNKCDRNTAAANGNDFVRCS